MSFTPKVVVVPGEGFSVRLGYEQYLDSGSNVVTTIEGISAFASATDAAAAGLAYVIANTPPDPAPDPDEDPDEVARLAARDANLDMGWNSN